jgi:hypothetical protein
LLQWESTTSWSRVVPWKLSIRLFKLIQWKRNWNWERLAYC